MPPREPPPREPPPQEPPPQRSEPSGAAFIRYAHIDDYRLVKFDPPLVIPGSFPINFAQIGTFYDGYWALYVICYVGVSGQPFDLDSSLIVAEYGNQQFREDVGSFGIIPDNGEQIANGIRQKLGARPFAKSFPVGESARLGLKVMRRAHSFTNARGYTDIPPNGYVMTLRYDRPKVVMSAIEYDARACTPP
jgi:hypothetical protein